MKHYKVVIKEIDNPYPLHRTITTNGDFEYVKTFFGCKEHNVEWYTIEKKNEREED